LRRRKGRKKKNRGSWTPSKGRSSKSSTGRRARSLLAPLLTVDRIFVIEVLEVMMGVMITGRLVRALLVGSQLTTIDDEKTTVWARTPVHAEATRSRAMTTTMVVEGLRIEIEDSGTMTGIEKASGGRFATLYETLEIEIEIEIEIWMKEEIAGDMLLVVMTIMMMTMAGAEIVAGSETGTTGTMTETETTGSLCRSMTSFRICVIS
jgi:hypothetical protein